MMCRPVKQPLLPPDLQESIRNGKCVAYIGSGASAAEYGSWAAVVTNLYEYCFGCTRSVSSPAEYLDAAEEAKNKDRNRYYDFLGKHFGRPALQEAPGRSVTTTNLLYRALLACNFKSYLTTNFDPLLALWARSASPKCRDELMVYPRLDRQHIDKRTVYYLHGLIDRGKVPVDGSIVLSRSEFTEAYEPDSELKNFLISTLSEDPVCFMGCSLGEPPLADVFQAIKKRQAKRVDLQARSTGRSCVPPLRYILLPTWNVLQENSVRPESDIQRMRDEEERCREFGICIRRYSTPTENDHSVLRQEFEKLARLSELRYSYDWDGGSEYGS